MIKAIIIGAGTAGKQLYELLKEKEQILGFFDDKAENRLGKLKDVFSFCEKEKVDKVYFAIPSMENRSFLDELFKKCKEKSIDLRIIPSVLDIIDGEVKINYIRDIKFEDLLFRPVRKSNIEKNKEFLKNKIVLVTGAAGTIGSELIKQSLYYGAKKVIGIDHNELGIFNQMNQYGIITGDKKDDSLIFHIKSIRDRVGLDYIFSKYKPDIVFNAAAYKHVYQMELNPDEAIKTNVIGLKNVIETALKHGTRFFCQISTDKAVNPTSIMGASKRLGELLVQYYANNQQKMKINAVRFGNVLGSSGSVLTIWKEQILQGKELTLTDKKVKRYFMSIEEAVNLVITSVTLNQTGKIFVLDMGEPIKIYELAKKFIQLSNAKGVGIKIIGLKPGEKLYEELVLDKDKFKKTNVDKIFVAEDKGNWQNILKNISFLEILMDKQAIIQNIKKIIPEFNHYLLSDK